MTHTDRVVRSAARVLLLLPRAFVVACARSMLPFVSLGVRSVCGGAWRAVAGRRWGRGIFLGARAVAASWPATRGGAGGGRTCMSTIAAYLAGKDAYECSPPWCACVRCFVKRPRALACVTPRPRNTQEREKREFSRGLFSGCHVSPRGAAGAADQAAAAEAGGARRWRRRAGGGATR